SPQQDRRRGARRPRRKLPQCVKSWAVPVHLMLPRGWGNRFTVVRFDVPPLVIAIVPARYHSTRLPGKALADIAGRPMIAHVYQRAAAAKSVSRVIVATDDDRIASAVRAFGGEVMMTSTAHQSGTDRLAEAVASL